MRLMLRFVLMVAIKFSAAIPPPSLSLDLISNPTLSSQSSFLEIPTSNLSLQSKLLPDDRFKVSLATEMTILPVDSALMNILYFMSIIAVRDFTQELQPRTYSTPNYRNIDIVSYAWTQTRFLLWGVYYAINYMIKHIRFHDTTLQLYWEGKLVGRMKIAVKRSLSLVDGATQDLAAQSNSKGSDEESTGSKVIGGNVTESDPAALAFNSSAEFAYPSGFSVDFSTILDAAPVKRNDLFLTFYNAFLHVAEFPAGSQMRTFQISSPNKALSLQIEEAGIACSYDCIVSALLYVPKYMMEHKEFGYKEADFIIKMYGQQACVGTIVQALMPPDETRTLKNSRADQ